MIPSEVKVNGVEMDGLDAAGTSKPVHVNVHIHQESALPELLNAGKSLFKFFVMLPGTPGRSSSESRLQVATWTSQIVLGAMSGALGVFFSTNLFFELKNSGVAFWTGAVAISAGVVAIIQEKRKGTWWSFLKTLFFLATVTTSIASIAICAGEVRRLIDYFRPPCNGEEVWPTRDYGTPNPQEAWRKSQCMDYMIMFQSLRKGILFVGLLVWITLLVVTLVPIGYTLVYSCFCHKNKVPPEEDIEEKKPLHGELSCASPVEVAGSCEA
ncbi:transmembrane protein 176A-like [Trichosurus vulpecula]|uniref:transmembrane protein 176A-like n=1 Tax=Trichosurus vulpecula TaxID=9337 RepID=UPI00186AF896|nr:transmembrane protein 176A-like [Trichosurus vulpecula]